MGYILNRFDKLMELKTDPTINEQFELTAVIVHDPKDIRIIEHIREFFIDLAEMTGKRFLFITFVQPPKKFADALRRGEYKYAKLLVSDSKQLSNTDTIINPYIRDYYDLPEDGSYIVLAEKLSDSKVFRIHTSTGDLTYQLMSLKKYCESPGNFDELIKKLEGETLYIKEMLIDSLLKIISLISPSSKPDKYALNAYSQRETARNTIIEEKQKLIVALKHSSDNEDLTDKVLVLYKIIEYAHRNVLNEGLRPSYFIPRCENYHLLDNKSKMFWDTFSRLSRFLEKASRDELDYSAFILYLGKIVETELNLSVCQMLRQSMGIAMPDFYNKYCYKTDKTVIPTAYKDVPINKYRFEYGKKLLEGVPLGDLLHAYKTAIGEEDSKDCNWSKPENIEKISENFMSLWRDIAQKRNDAAHSRSVDVDMFKNTENLFKEFLNIYLLDFYSIKEKLRPGNKTHSFK